MIIALSGHREKRLNLPLSIKDKQWTDILNWLKETITNIINEHPNEEIICYSGLACGSDMAFACAVIDLKKQGYNIKLHGIAPCNNYNCSDPNYKYVYRNCDNVIDIHDEWIKGCDTDRDNYMLEHCDILIVIYDKIRTGGVYNIIKNAEKINKPIIYCPEEIVCKHQNLF